MSAIQDLLAVAEYNRGNAILGGAPAQGFTGGYAKRATDEYERKKQLEDTKTGFAKLKQLMDGQSQDYQNHYKIKPTLSAKGELGYGLAEKSDSDMFSQAVSSGTNASELYKQFPQFADKIDLLRRRRMVPEGMSIQPQLGTPIQSAQGTRIPIVNDVPSDLVTPQEKKLAFEMQEKNEKRQKTESALKDSAQQTINTIAEIKSGLKYFGAMGDLPPYPAEYEKKNWVANYNRLKDKLVVDLMLQLKAASPTGSTGFGQLSEKEGMRLENAATALQKGMKESDAIRYLDELESGAKKILLGDDSQNENNKTDNAGNSFSYLWQ